MWHSGVIAAPTGWRVAIADPETETFIVVPIVGWTAPPPVVPKALVGLALDMHPVVLFDNVDEPIISTLADCLSGWHGTERVHQILAPGADVRHTPATKGWEIVPYSG
ncbi:hypothetical protein [Streptomyces sp. SM12]|uniref:hypothetical protein n=1 Tax=Streptomyces sp. SM12 TaxID=1071602 RepID=UPI000CD54691|nr:hypothetical protein [Streptomyces sp. SM12]